MTRYFVPWPERSLVVVVFDDPDHAESRVVPVHVVNAPEKCQTQAVWWMETAAIAVSRADSQCPEGDPCDLLATLTIHGANPP